MTTRRDFLRRIAAPLEPLYGPAEARQIALSALSARTGIAPAALLADPGAPLDLPGAEALASELATGRPLQYVLGFSEFCGLRIGVREGVLIPRPETEELVAWVAAENSAARRLLDIGTGSGCIALALKHLLPAATVCGADLSTEALVVARANAAALGLEVEFRRADALRTDHPVTETAEPQPASNPDPLTTEPSGAPGLPASTESTPDTANTPDAPAGDPAPLRPNPLPTGRFPVGPPATGPEGGSSLAGDFSPAPALSDVFAGPFDAVVSNPPYIPASERASMRRNVTDYEPGRALFVPDDDPLRFYRAIARTGHRLLAPGGALYFEIHECYGAALCRLLSGTGFTAVELRHDFRGKPRMIRARKPTAP